MSEIVSNILKGKTERIIQLVALATNQHATSRNGWTWKAQEDPKLASLEANLNDEKHELYNQFGVIATVKALYALDGKKFSNVRTWYDIPTLEFSYGAVVVPTFPVIGGLPDAYEPGEHNYDINKPVMCVSTWRKSENPNQRGRGIKNASADLKTIPFLPRRADLTRPGTDEEITTVVTALVDARGVTFVDDVLRNLEDMYAHLLDA